MARRTMVEAIRWALETEMARDPDIVVLGEDVGRNGGVFRATEGLFERFGTERVIDTPLAESGIVGTAIGMALGGLRPVAEIQFEGFLLPAFDQIAAHAARYASRTRGQWSVPLVVRSPCGGGIHAPEHHSDSIEALFTQVPGLRVLLPSTPHDAAGLLRSAIREPNPVIFFEPKRLYRSHRQEIPDDPEAVVVPIGSARFVRRGRDVTCIAWGASVHEATRAVADAGLDAEIIDLRSLAPIDFDTLCESVSRTGRAVIVHEAPRTGGLGAEIAATLHERCARALKAPVTRVTGFDAVMPLYQMEALYMPDPPRIARALRAAMEF